MMNEKVDLKGSVILNPVPVVMVTSRGKDGKDNVFTVGWVGTVCTKPPYVNSRKADFSFLPIES